MARPFIRTLARVLVPAAVLAAGCQDFDPPAGPKPRVVETTRTGPATTKTVAVTGKTDFPPRAATGRTFVATNTVIPRVTFVVPVAHTKTATFTPTFVVAVPALGVDARNGVPILEAILSNPIKAETEFRNRGVRLQGLGTVGKDDRGYFISFPTTAVAPGDIKPQPGIVARIPRGDESLFRELKRDATVTIHAVVRSWRQDVPEAFRGVVIEMDQATLVGVAHTGY